MCKSDFWVIFKALLDLHLRYNYTCVLKPDTFFLGRDMITQEFSFHSYPYKPYESSPTIAAIVISLRHKSPVWMRFISNYSNK